MARDPNGIIQIKWANAGDRGLGGINLNELWPISYSTSGGEFPKRIQFNELYFRLSTLAVELNQGGAFLEYNNTIDYVAGAMVLGSDGNRYRANAANGPSSSVVDPVGDATGVWTNLDRAFAGFIDGLILSNDSGDTDHDIATGDGVATFKNGSGGFRPFVGLSLPTKQIDAAWAEGDDAGGFPTGISLSANSHYYYFLIAKDDGTIDAGFDSNVNATNLLADATGYTWFRHVGDILTDGGSDIRNFQMFFDGRTILNVSNTEVNDATGTSGVYETLVCNAQPPNAIGIFRCAARADTCADIEASLRAVGGTHKRIGWNDVGSSSTKRIVGWFEVYG